MSAYSLSSSSLSWSSCNFGGVWCTSPGRILDIRCLQGPSSALRELQLLEDNTTQEGMIDATTNDDMINDNLDSETEHSGESRLELHHIMGVTWITLEALLYGHEEGVTSVTWHPSPSLCHQDRILISSSMDRTCLLCSCDNMIWAPVGRVGSAGGISCGSRGSTVLESVHACVKPLTGMTLIGQAHGGAFYVCALEECQEMEQQLMTVEMVLHNKSQATPSATGILVM